MCDYDIENERYPHDVEIVRVVPGKGSDDNPYADDDAPLTDAEEILYTGIGRVYTDTTTVGDSRVDENKRKASIPVRFDEWSEEDFPLDGDLIRCTIGNYKEEGIVKDCEGDNDRTVVYWSLRRV